MTLRTLIPLSLLSLLTLSPHSPASSEGAAEAAPARIRCTPGTSPDSARLSISGSAHGRVLLTTGLEPEREGRTPGCRLQAEQARWIELDPSGRATLELQRTRRPIFAQVWTPPQSCAAQPAGSWSQLVVALPPAGQLASTATSGDLLITEFLKDPTTVADSKGEWIELRNLLPWRLDIAGVVLSDASGAAFVFDNGGAPLYLRPDQAFVVGAEADSGQNGGVQVDWEWTGFSLRNSEDQIYLHDRDGVLLDSVEYDDGILWPDLPGRSISLLPAFTWPQGNDLPSAWCHSTSTFGSGSDTGTPGQPNDECP